MSTEEIEPFSGQEIIQAEIPIVENLINHEIEIVSRNEGHPVSPDDAKVVKRTCRLIQRLDKAIRMCAIQTLKSRTMKVATS